MHRDYYSAIEWEKIIAFSRSRETPFLIVLLDMIQHKFGQFRTGFPDAKINDAVKANPAL